jgi:hypothetical protein
MVLSLRKRVNAINASALHNACYCLSTILNGDESVYRCEPRQADDGVSLMTSVHQIVHALKPSPTNSKACANAMRLLVA